jgi:hypothetical protein
MLEEESVFIYDFKFCTCFACPIELPYPVSWEFPQLTGLSSAASECH